MNSLLFIWFVCGFVSFVIFVVESKSKIVSDDLSDYLEKNGWGIYLAAFVILMLLGTIGLIGKSFKYIRLLWA